MPVNIFNGFRGYIPTAETGDEAKDFRRCFRIIQGGSEFLGKYTGSPKGAVAINHRDLLFAVENLPEKIDRKGAKHFQF